MKAAVLPKTPSSPQPAVRRVTGKIDLSPPQGYMLSVLLKEVDRDEQHRYYAWWLSAGRNDLDVLSVPFDCSGADVIRCDLPDGMEISAAALQPAVSNFFSGNEDEKKKLDGGSPIIRGSGGGGGGTGGTKPP